MEEAGPKGPASVALSIALQTHPARAALALDLQQELVRQGARVELAVDPDPEGDPSPWRTYRLALETTPAWATHRLVIQDDAVLCTNFAAAAALALAARPAALVAFFVAGAPRDSAARVRQAAARDVHWAELSSHHWVPTIATCWPAPLIGSLVSFVDQQGWPPSFRADDEIVGRFVNRHHIRALATAPSLVQHPDDVPSLIGRRASDGKNPYRVAACFIGDCDPLTIDWQPGPC